MKTFEVSRRTKHPNLVKQSILGKLKNVACIRAIYVFVTTSFDLVRSISIRIVFCIHALIAICLVCFVQNDLWYFVNVVGIVFIILEFVIIALPNGGKDLFWFSPSFFLYILTLIPPTWFLELENIRIKTLKLQRIENVTKTHMHLESFDLSDSKYSEYDIGIKGLSGIPVSASDIRLLLSDSTQNFAMYIEVTMMLIIIVARWTMPKEGITRSELSQLLLVYMSLTSDIIDLLSVLGEQTIIMSYPMVYATLSIYSWSLFQFTLNLVVNRGRNMGTTGVQNRQNERELAEAMVAAVAPNTSTSPDKPKRRKSRFDSELLNVMITLIMQDGPFFILRMFCIFKFDIASYLFLFFTFKNGILFSLQIYRIIAIRTDNHKQNKIINRMTAAAAAVGHIPPV